MIKVRKATHSGLGNMILDILCGFIGENIWISVSYVYFSV